MAALRCRVDGCRECRLSANAPAKASGFREHAEMDQRGLDQIVLFDFAGTRQRDDPCGEPPTIFSGIGFVPLDAKKSFPDRIESARQSGFGVVTIGKDAGGCHPG